MISAKCLKTVPDCAWPGGYPLIYLTNNCDIICPSCARKIVRDGVEDELDNLHSVQVYDTGPTLECTICDKPMDSAYGDPDDDGPMPE